MEKMRDLRGYVLPPIAAGQPRFLRGEAFAYRLGNGFEESANLFQYLRKCLGLRESSPAKEDQPQPLMLPVLAVPRAEN
jgi:hypothetical protein